MNPSPIDIVAVEAQGPFQLRLQFDDHTEQVIDFYPFLSRSRHPDLRIWLDPARFADYRLEHGELIWGDYELCFPMSDLYHNTIDHFKPRVAVA
ncbi:MAG: DUF2442 domain-containing protein [Magnetococcus sp. YQC-9]